MLRAILYQQWLKVILIALVALILYGVFPGTALAAVLLLFVGLRLISLAAEALGKRPPSIPSDTDATDETAVALPTRSKWELIAEACGVFSYGIALPLALALTTHDFFSLRLPQDWRGALVAALALSLYVWPLRLLRSPRFALLRIGWWAGPLLPVLFLVQEAITTRHPYLNPFDADHKQRAAEQVLALKNNIMAGRHAGWVLDYARQLEDRGDSKRAAEFYHATLRLDPVNQAAVERLAVLEPHPTSEPSPSVAALPLAPLAPFWSANNPITKTDRRRISPSLETVAECTVILVPMGEVSDDLLDAVAHTVHRELGLPVLISPDRIALPPHTRVRGLVTGRQWDHNTLVQAFLQASQPLPNAPIKYLMVTSVDIYMDGAAFVFSVSYDLGGLVSSARFSEGEHGTATVLHRTAKQSLCALLKGFKIPPSSDHHCVTSYTQNLAEFDDKGNRPTPATLTLFRQAVGELNRGWRSHKGI